MPAAPEVSLVTAALEPDPAELLAAYGSLAGPAPSWEWLIQLDGGDGVVPDEVLVDGRVHVEENGSRVGSAASRNRALARARGRLVQSLDADDLLLPDALASLAAAFADPEIAFAFGGSADLRDGGVRSEPYRWFEPGRVAAGEIERVWRREGVVPIRGGAVMWRREVLLALGGWAALLSGEDTAVVLSASAMYPSAYVGRDVMVYRRHARQLTQREEYARSRDLDRRFAAARLEAVRRLFPR